MIQKIDFAGCGPDGGRSRHWRTRMLQNPFYLFFTACLGLFSGRIPADLC